MFFLIRNLDKCSVNKKNIFSTQFRERTFVSVYKQHLQHKTHLQHWNNMRSHTKEY